jgi:hypothetical protein
MRKTPVSIVTVAVAFAGIWAGASASAACECPPVSLDERIAGAVAIFSGRPLIFAQIPAGASPFHTGNNMDSPEGVSNDIVTIFQVDMMWKGEPRRRIKIRRSPGGCSTDFKVDKHAIVFVKPDSNGILWTGACSGDAVEGDERYETLKAMLTDRLKYN